MNAKHLLFAGLMFLSPLWAHGQEKADVKPLLRLEAGGPTSNVTSIVFSPDGKTLYAAGFDKVVRAWTWNAATARFELNETTAFRVPIGPGADGALNAMAISEDGYWGRRRHRAVP